MNKKMLEQKFEDLLNFYEFNKRMQNYDNAFLNEFKQGGEFDTFKEEDVL